MQQTFHDALLAAAWPEGHTADLCRQTEELEPCRKVRRSVNLETLGWDGEHRAMALELEDFLNRCGIGVNVRLDGGAEADLAPIPAAELDLVSDRAWGRTVQKKFDIQYVWLGDAERYAGLDGLCTFCRDIGLGLRMEEAVEPVLRQARAWALEETEECRKALGRYKTVLVTPSVLRAPFDLRTCNNDYGLTVSHVCVLPGADSRRAPGETPESDLFLADRVRATISRYDPGTRLVVDPDRAALEAIFAGTDAVVGSGDPGLEGLGAPVIPLLRPLPLLSFPAYVRSVKRLCRSMAARVERKSLLLERAGDRPREEEPEGDLMDWFPLMERYLGLSPKRPVVNVLGLGPSDPYAVWEREALDGLLRPKAELGVVIPLSPRREAARATRASLNLVVGGRGLKLARAMEDHFGIPWEEIDYPYGLTGADRLWRCLERRLGVNYEASRYELEQLAEEGLGRCGPCLRGLYGMRAAILASAPRADGLRRFLEQELGMEVVAFGRREELADPAAFREALVREEAELLFASLREGELARSLGIPLIRVEAPVFDRISLTPHPLMGGEGLLHLLEDIFRGLMG